MTLSSKRAVCQLIVTGHFANGTRDLTREATFTSSEAIIELRDGIRAVPEKKDGKCELAVTVGKLNVQVPVEVSGQSKPDPVRFGTETLAVLTKHGCNSGSCHGSPQGKGGFSLSLFGYDPTIDAESIVRGGLNRRVDAFTPSESLLLKKPLMRVPHVGGKRLNKSDPGYQVLLDWIAAGAKTNDDASAACVQITVHPGTGRILSAPHLSQQLSVLAKFADGSTRVGTTRSTFDVSNREVLSVSDSGLIGGRKRGQGAVSVRYLNRMESVHFTVIEEVEGFNWNNPPEANFIDRLVHAKLNQLRVLPSDGCNDSTFLRRVYLDLTGLLPTAEKARSFLSDSASDKRAKVIDELLASEEFARYWALRSADLMRVNAKTLPEGRADLFANWLIDGIPKEHSIRQCDGNRAAHRERRRQSGASRELFPRDPEPGRPGRDNLATLHGVARELREVPQSPIRKLDAGRLLPDRGRVRASQKSGQGGLVDRDRRDETSHQRQDTDSVRNNCNRSQS